MNLITSLTKDKVLFYLCKEAQLEVFLTGKTSVVLQQLEIDFNTFNAIMLQFQRFGFVESLNLTRSNFSFILLTDAHDFAIKGGFLVQEEIFKGNLEKLGFEIDNLKKQLAPNNLDSLNKISSIASALFSGLALLPKK